jgi:peptide/nickel transport system permease protein
MYRYLVRRLLWAIVLFIAATMITYITFFVIPYDPAVLAAGSAARPADIERVRHFMGLDHSVPMQYLLFLKRLVVDQSLAVRS